MRSHTQSVVIEPNRRRITASIFYKPLISDISVLIVCNKTGGTIKGDKKIMYRPAIIWAVERKNFRSVNYVAWNEGQGMNIDFQ